MSDLIYNFSANTSQFAANVTDLLTNGAPVQVCIQTQEQIAWNNRIEIWFAVLCFLLAVDVILTVVKWQKARREL